MSSATYTITTAVSAGTSPVNLAAAFNVDAIGSNGVPVTNGGLDTWGYAYSSSLLGSTVTWSGVTFDVGTPGTLSAVSNATITLPAIRSTKLNLLALAVNGSHQESDLRGDLYGRHDHDHHAKPERLVLSQNFAGESIAVTMAYRINQFGVVDNHAVNLYGYSFAIDSTKTVMSLKLPASRNVVKIRGA